MENDQTTIYWLDREKRIVRINTSWDRFARDNGGDSLLAEQVEGRLIWDFVQGDATRMWLDTLFSLALVHSRVVERPYRCDSPSLRRYMRMHLVPEQPDLLRVEHHLLAVEPRPQAISIQPALRAARHIRPRCSLCGLVRLDAAWLEPEEAAAATEQLSGPLQVIYTVCEQCQCLLPQGS